jgi:single-stranded-DNA-specific exonuclease
MNASLTGKRWVLLDVPEEAVRELSQDLGIDPILGRILYLRNVRTRADGVTFLECGLDQLANPMEIPGLVAAADRLLAAIENKEKVCIYGDYDVDGVTATSLIVGVLRRLGGDASYFIPHRIKHGYGLHADAVRQIRRAGTDLLVTVDNGISAHEEVALASSLGLDVIITDHHEPSAELPDTPFVINPKVNSISGSDSRGETTDEFAVLSGVGLAFALMIAVRARLRERDGTEKMKLPNLREYLDLVAIGTIGDVVPLTGPNRILVRHGLREIGQSRNKGIHALMRTAGLNGAFVTPGQVGFQLAPRINAAGRMGDAELAIRLLISDDDEEIDSAAARLNQENIRRQEVEQQILSQVLEKIDKSDRGDRVIVLKSAEWHPGVIGIVASRVVERFFRPTILITRKERKGTGSGRSIPGFSLYDALEACRDELEGFGGHKMAAGLTIGWDRIDSFHERINRYAEGVLLEEDLIPKRRVDAVLDPDRISEALVDGLERFKPFGMGNPEPLFLSRNVVVEDLRVVGKNHLKFRIRCRNRPVQVIGFNLGQLINDVRKAKALDLLYQLRYNEFNGSRAVQAFLTDLMPSQQKI